MLPFVDHNHYLNRCQLLRKDGSSVFVGHNGKRTKLWHAVPVLPEKQDAYIPDTCNAFRRRTLLVLGIHV